jgi:hypothetical protein
MGLPVSSGVAGETHGFCSRYPNLKQELVESEPYDGANGLVRWDPFHQVAEMVAVDE